MVYKLTILTVYLDITWCLQKCQKKSFYFFIVCCNTQWWHSIYIDLHWFWVYKRGNFILISKKIIFLSMSYINIMNTTQFSYKFGAKTVEEHHFTTHFLVFDFTHNNGPPRHGYPIINLHIYARFINQGLNK